MESFVMSGNEAVALGAYEAGCTIATAYPGTPSSEILENISNYEKEIVAHWACNEKVATEIAAGASIGGARALCAMKHVGMNVAADPIFTMGYAGVNGGLVIVCADDPGCHSSQNEQDNRLYAPHAKLAMMEPSDSQECKDFTVAAFELSERFDIPVLLRMTTRVCHSKSIVRPGLRKDVGVKPYVRDPDKYAMLPATARRRHAIREDLLVGMEEYANDCPFNIEEENPGARVGIITSGISYQHSREVFGRDASYLKIGLSYPLPRKMIRSFASKFDTVYVIEENEPHLENVVRQLGIDCVGKDRLPICGELNAQIIRQALLGAPEPETYQAGVKIPGRPPVLCAGCPHRGFFYTISRNRKRLVPVGDIGCYGLGVNPPFNGLDHSICMGSGFSSIIGLAKALELQGDQRKVLGMVGDSTFFHSGINSLIDLVTSQANVIACILDNSITAMTGHQNNPGSGRNIRGEPVPSVDIYETVKAIGVPADRIRQVDPLDVEAMKQAFDEGIANEKGPFVIITQRPCVLIKEVARAQSGQYCEIDQDLCTGCQQCMRIACPSISFSNGKAQIVDQANCTACGLCIQLCRFNAIKKVGV